MSDLHTHVKVLYNVTPFVPLQQTAILFSTCIFHIIRDNSLVMTKRISNADLLKIIDRALNEQGISARQASLLAIGTPELIRNMRRGRVPSVERFSALCDVLNLEFYVGPKYSQKSPSVRVVSERQIIPDMLEEIISRLPPRKTLKQTPKRGKSYEDSKSTSVYRIPVVETDTTMNDISTSNKKRAVGHIFFQESWFSGQDLNPEYCLIVQILDHSMEPTIANHSMVLVDLSRYRRQQERIYAIRIGNSLIVRRLTKVKDKWQLISDNQKSKPVPFPSFAEIIGEVRWMAKTFN